MKADLACRSQDKKRAKYTLKHAIRSMYATPEVRAGRGSAVPLGTCDSVGLSFLQVQVSRAGYFVWFPAARSLQSFTAVQSSRLL